MTTYLVHVVLELGDQVVVMRYGRVVFMVM